MSLQLKVIALLVVLVLPMTAGFSLLRLTSERRDQQERHAERVLVRAATRPLNKCNRAPERFAFRRKRFTVYGYDASLNALNPAAPALPTEFKEALNKAPDEVAHARVSDMALSAIRVDSDGPCETLVLSWRTQSALLTRGLTRIVLSQSLMFLLALLATGLLITTPLVRRIRRLTREVQRAPEQGLRVDSEILAKDELGQLARAFNTMGVKVHATIDQLEQRDLTLKTYIANTTHDLAIPLTVLQHRLRKMQRQVEQDEPVGAQQLARAMEESHYIASLIANMSAAAKLDAGAEHITKHEVDLGQLIERVGARHDPLATQRGIDFNWSRPSDPALAHVDSVLLEQAVSNLVQNAIQYNHKGGHVSLVLDVLDDACVFECKVLDDGPGVPEAMLGEVTLRHNRGVFEHNDARTRGPAGNPKGQGFGLSIVEKVCTLHGFSLHLENIPEAGLMATIRGSLGTRGDDDA